ncbi:helix-turn-helix domain-containing protein [candidate division KSB1 bacterium]|nr:helix-turn-helix domain-containing protein [candidate division KSB1 bacterium]
METKTLSGWVSEAEARDLLHSRTTKLWQLRKTGQLEYSRIGKRVFYRLSSIEALLEANAVNVKHDAF